MRNLKAIFKKQLKSTIRNPGILFQFIVFPLLAFLMDIMMVTDFEGIPQDIADMLAANMPNMVTMQATMFAGMGLIMVIAGIVAEDIEKKSLRFLMMAGVKPGAYLLGTSSVIFVVSFFTSVAFSLISEFTGVDFWIFTASLMSGVTGSIIVGATIGILTKNQQAASGLSLPIGLLLGFGPMMAQFNDRVANALHVFYTQQLNVVAAYLTTGGVDTPLWQSFAIMWGNVAVLGVLFAIVYKMKGLKG